MAFNDNAVFTAATGYVYFAEPGTAAPTPEQLRDFDPETFGANKHKLVVKAGSAAEAGTFTVKVGGKATEGLAPTASAAEVQQALEALDTVGSGNVVVTGTDLKTGYTVAFVGSLFGKAVEVEADGAQLGGTGGSAEVEELAAPAGWEPIGHTGNEDLPEFGYEGGDTETKGSWQKKILKEVTTDTPVDYVTLKALQFDEPTLEMYYGKNASKTPGVFGVENAGAGGIEKAILIVMVDGSFKIAFSAAKTSVRRDESISLATDDFSTLPLRSTFVKHPGRLLFEWTAPAASA